MMSLQEEILQYGQRARVAARLLAQLDAGQKNAALLAMADEIMSRADAILAENEKDLAQARSNGLASAMIDRLKLNGPRLEEMAQGVRAGRSSPRPRWRGDPRMELG
jgi:glutamate-5-semialdehyde dehydrogenase